MSMILVGIGCFAACAHSITRTVDTDGPIWPAMAWSVASVFFIVSGLYRLIMTP